MKKTNQTDITNFKLDNLLTPKQVSEIIGIEESTLARWRCHRQNLQFVKIGKAVRYRQEDVFAFINDNLVPAA